MMVEFASSLFKFLSALLSVIVLVVIMILGVIYGLIAAKVYPPFLNYTGMVSLPKHFIYFSPNFHIINISFQTRIDPHWILHLFLPVLIFESSFAIPLHLFRQSIWHIILLATAGLGQWDLMTTYQL